jgi:hypothetical protein
MQHELSPETRRFVSNSLPDENAAYDFWQHTLNAVGETIIRYQPDFFGLFSEDWSTERQLKICRETVQERTSQFLGALSFNAFMVSMGAEPHITEDALLIRRAELAQQRVMRIARRNPNRIPVADVAAMHEAVVVNRDRAIGTRLAKTVPDNGLAILAMGAGHDVPKYLDETWEIVVVTTPNVLAVAESGPDLGKPEVWPKIYRAQSRP